MLVSLFFLKFSFSIAETLLFDGFKQFAESKESPIKKETAFLKFAVLIFFWVNINKKLLLK
jgi:hypothetical protein